MLSIKALRGMNAFNILQGFSWTVSKLLRTSLQCVVVRGEAEGTRPQLEDCIIGGKDKWVHKRVSGLHNNKKK